jgi:hypothetical protein
MYDNTESNCCCSLFAFYLKNVCEISVPLKTFPLQSTYGVKMGMVVFSLNFACYFITISSLTNILGNPHFEMYFP